MAASLHDVAKRAGVSPRTVSNVVNDFVHVRPQTREKVLAAIEELGYRPNIAARRLRQGRTGIVGFVVPELSQPYFAELSELIEAEAQSRDYTVIATQTGGDATRERRALDEFTTQVIDGVIFSPMGLSQDDFAAATPQVPLVLIGEQITSPGYLSIAIDNVAAIRDATAHLIASGRTRIATLGAYHSDLYRSSALRLEGYEQAIAEAGLQLDPELVLYTDEFSRRAGYAGVERALREGVEFDAIMCFTDMLAFGAMRALADAGVRVPEDVAIAAIDDVQEAEFSIPRLTSVAPSKDAIVSQAFDALLALIDGGERPEGLATAPYRLVVRESSGGGAG
ncbi:LacI family DNA-binding transcriptional regulator [Salinibacterium sp. ZJ70]|uniref:LacI family DNA-binding transcriptional regulator n=1 Tax=Salinibacterium sp. ZJ70 TaxID=2708084 RepID=UPI00142475A0|nr:LacI family DNA-binding transcriptional regulator [Salinibacterium sp. ZJ70]